MSLPSSTVNDPMGGPPDLMNKYVGNGTSLEQLRSSPHRHVGAADTENRRTPSGVHPSGGTPPPQMSSQQQHTAFHGAEHTAAKPPPMEHPQHQYYDSPHPSGGRQQSQPPPPHGYHYYPHNVKKNVRSPSGVGACIPYTNVQWIVFVVMIFLFILLSNASIYKLQSQFVPIQFLSDDNPPIILVIFNSILFGILFLVVNKLVGS